MSNGYTPPGYTPPGYTPGDSGGEGERMQFTLSEGRRMSFALVERSAAFVLEERSITPTFVTRRVVETDWRP